MPANLEGILYWHWLVAGLVFLILEAFAPGAIFLWMGVAAVAVGLLAGLLPALNWQAEFVLFGVLALAAFFLWRRYKPAAVSDKPTLNKRNQSYVGRVFTLEAPIVNGIGKLHVDDSQWRISGPDTPAGSQVRVTEADGTTLKVEQVH